MAGDGNDPDDLIVQAFKAYDMDGKIDSKMFQHALMTWGDKMTKAEIDDIFGEFEIDEDCCIKTKEVVGLFVAVKEEEKKEPTPPPEVVEAPPPEEEDDSKKKKEEEGCKVNVIHPIGVQAVFYLPQLRVKRHVRKCHVSRVIHTE